MPLNIKDPETERLAAEIARLTGESKTYLPYATNNNMGTFANPRPARPFAFDGKNWGAWEIAGRYSSTDLDYDIGSKTAADRVFGGGHVIVFFWIILVQSRLAV